MYWPIYFLRFHTWDPVSGERLVGSLSVEHSCNLRNLQNRFFFWRLHILWANIHLGKFKTCQYFFYFLLCRFFLCSVSLTWEAVSYMQVFGGPCSLREDCPSQF